MLLRRVIGDVLRARRQDQHRTLREVSHAANVSLGYLSEIERGQKEASSELLAAICDALGSELADVLRDVSDSLARVSRADAPVAVPDLPVSDLPVPDLPEPELAGVASVEPGVAAGSTELERAEPEFAEPEFAEAAFVEPALSPAARTPEAPAVVDRPARVISDGKVSVSVRRYGPLRTTLHAVPARRSGDRVDDLAGSSAG